MVARSPPPAGGAANQRTTGGTGGASFQQGPGGGPGGGGGDGPRMVIMEGSNLRYRADLYINVQNLFNQTNLNGFIGNQLSPFFGRATSAWRRGASNSARPFRSDRGPARWRHPPWTAYITDRECTVR